MLRKINDKELLWYPINSLMKYTNSKNIFVATSDDESDNSIQEYCEKIGIQCFRGDLNNVALRFKTCLHSIDCDYAVRICGDNLFLSHQLLNQLNDIIKLDEYDFISNTQGRTYPYGMSLEAIKKQVYLDHYSEFEVEKGDFEHVMPYFYRSESVKKYFMINELYPNCSGLRLAIDTLYDVEFAQRILNNIASEYYNITLEEICNLAIQLKKSE